MKHTGKYFYAVIYLIALLGFAGCSSKLSVTAKADRSTDVSFQTAMGPVLSTTIRSIASGMGSNYVNSKNGQGLFDTETIQEAFNDSDFTGVKVATPTQNSLSISASLPHADHQTHATGTLRAADFITCSDKVLVLTISPENLRTMAEGLPVSTKGYLDLFMAPVFTGEKMKRSEYRSLIATVYGENIAKELESSNIDVDLLPPKGKSIKKAAVPKSGSKVTGAKATFSIPLLDFLTMSTTETYSIEW